SPKDVLAAAILFLLPLLLFAPVTLGSKTLLPADNRFTFEPFASFAAEVGVDEPHNRLLSDLILENYVWKRYIREAIARREVPLWNPYIFSGQPFLANGQHSAMYPFSVLFYVLPLEKAYGWFTVVQLWLAGLFTYVFLRVLRASRAGALLGGMTFGLSGFFLNRVVFTMILAGAVWLPLVLAVIEQVIRKQEEKGTAAWSPIPYLAAGSAAMGMQVLAGHIEITYYVLLVSALYALWRLVGLWRAQKTLRPALRLAGWLLVMMLVGLGLGAVQFIPFLEIGTANFREGAVSLAQVRGWALPARRIISFVIPNFFGSPAHHGYFDVVSRTWQPLGPNAHGGVNPLCPHCTGWDTKTAVEAGAYTGILPLTLAALAVISVIRQASSVKRQSSIVNRQSSTVNRQPSSVKRTTHALFFALLALLSLLFAFGTPLYAVLFYGLPGWNQLHSPFRWIYPFTLSVAVLAGLGATSLEQFVSARRNGTPPGDAPHPLALISLRLGWLLFWGGLAGVLAMLAALVVPAPFIALGQAVVDRSGLAQNAFANGRQFFGYQWPNFFKFFLMVMAAGAVLRIVRCPIFVPKIALNAWKPLAFLVIALDLMLANADFNPAADPRLLAFTPPAIEWLKARQAEDPFFRLTSFDTPGGRGDKILNANTAMDYRLFDVRGYDSVILAQYARFMQTIQPNGDLLYNRVGPVYHPGYAALDSALLDLLGVRYVLTTETIPNAGYRLAYDGEIKIYENLDALPRAFMVAQAETDIADMETALRSLDPRRTVLLDGAQINPGHDLPPEVGEPPSQGRDRQLVSITAYRGNEVVVETCLVAPGWLVLADTYFPGWKATVRPQGGETETEVTIHRADGNFRAVYLPAGAWTVRFRYSPMSFKLGLYVTFLAGVVWFMLLVYWSWGRAYRQSVEESTVQRVAKNSLAPMVLALLNRGIDFAFALLMLRILAPQGVGRYAFAVSLITLFEILTRFGLGTLLTREVAKDHAQGNRYLSNVVLLRGVLGLLAIPLIGGVLGFYAVTGNLTSDVVYTVAFFVVGLFFSNIADALTALFYAYEKAEYPAFIATVTAVTRVALGALALLLGGGIVGLAAVSVVANLVSVGVLGAIFRRKIFHPTLERDGALQREMVSESLPLMINHLLATVFFRIDVFILKPTWGDDAVGYYNAAYKYIDGINIIPQYFTLAIFPLMSRYASSSRESLVRAYVLSLRLLQLLAIPVAVGTPFIARDLILLLGGEAYLPHSMIALQLLIWFLPFSFVNQVTQYVLIAVGQQRFLTKAFLIGVAFNILANLLLIPRYGYPAAAITTILSEWSLLIPFYYAVRKHVCRVPWLDVVWRPAVSAGAMGVALWLLRDAGTPVLLPVGAAVYFAVLWGVGGFRQPDMDLVWSALPGRGKFQVSGFKFKV
ncbi:MAG: hypothetical protein D6796_15935, partial [Caldilineae bacterium]